MRQLSCARVLEEAIGPGLTISWGVASCCDSAGLEEGAIFSWSSKDYELLKQASAEVC